MPFHVEIRSGYQRARAFNLAAHELRDRLLLPWLAERRIELGDQTWDPRDARITVLEGPPLVPADLNYGQGWDNACKRSRDVTESALETVRASSGGASPSTARAPSGTAAPAGVAVLAASSPAAQHVRERLVAELRLQPLEWSTVRARLLARAAVLTAPAPENTALLAILDGPPDAALALDLGLALGALGGRVVIATAGDAPGVAAALPGIAAIDSSATEAIAERLRLAT